MSQSSFSLAGFQVWKRREVYRRLGLGLMVFTSLLFPIGVLFFSLYSRGNRAAWQPIYVIWTAPLCLLLLFVGIACFLSISGGILITGPGGLLLKEGGSFIKARWSDIHTYGKFQSQGVELTGFLLEAGVSKRKISGWLKAMRVISPLLKIAALSSGRYFYTATPEKSTTVIDLSNFAYDWYNEPLGDIFRKYAPHLFNNFGRPLEGEYKFASQELVLSEAAQPLPDETLLKEAEGNFSKYAILACCVAVVLLLVLAYIVS